MARVNQCRMSVASTDSADNKYGIFMTGAAVTGLFVFPEISDVTVQFDRVAADTTIGRVGVYLACEQGAVRSGSIRGLHCTGQDIGVYLNAVPSGAGAASIHDIRIDACTAALSFTSTAFAAGSGGCILQATAGAQVGAMDRIGVGNCSFGQAAAGSFGIIVVDAAVDSAVVVMNHLATTVGTAVSDSGTSTEFGHNIV